MKFVVCIVSWGELSRKNLCSKAKLQFDRDNRLADYTVKCFYISLGLFSWSSDLSYMIYHKQHSVFGNNVNCCDLDLSLIWDDNDAYYDVQRWHVNDLCLSFCGMLEGDLLVSPGLLNHHYRMWVRNKLITGICAVTICAMCIKSYAFWHLSQFVCHHRQFRVISTKKAVVSLLRSDAGT